MMHRRGTVYIAGPITSDPLGGTASAMQAFHELADYGFAPFAPQLSILLQIMQPRTWEDWLEMDFAWLRHADAVLRLPGESKGADAEVAFAQQRSIPVFYHLADLLRSPVQRHPRPGGIVPHG